MIISLARPPNLAGLARRIIFYEQVFVALNSTRLVNIDLHCGKKGEKDGETFYFESFESVEKNKEGYGQGNSRPVFDPHDTIIDDTEDDMMDGSFLEEEVEPQPTPPTAELVKGTAEVLATLQQQQEQYFQQVINMLQAAGVAGVAGLQAAGVARPNAAAGLARDTVAGRGSESEGRPSSESKLKVRTGLYSGMRRAPSLQDSINQ